MLCFERKKKATNPKNKKSNLNKNQNKNKGSPQKKKEKEMSRQLYYWTPHRSPKNTFTIVL